MAKMQVSHPLVPQADVEQLSACTWQGTVVCEGLCAHRPRGVTSIPKFHTWCDVHLSDKRRYMRGVPGSESIGWTRLGNALNAANELLLCWATNDQYHGVSSPHLQEI